MTFLRGVKANVKQLFAERAYKSLAELKSTNTNYKQVYRENHKTNFELPIEWRNKKNFRRTPYEQQRDQRQPAVMEARTCWLRDRDDGPQ
ncbi:hypothetical protein EVAR_102645_1 [Eumeta japonica]|uniref:Uncharacterized protein n=1 Tax=Eumeta variegata TaxID=151549 RepID=A0A4C1TVN9_EUMVA|nr:hypothetical protein EVAR_102645_1 [Eumeta japonica]